MPFFHFLLPFRLPLLLDFWYFQSGQIHFNRVIPIGSWVFRRISDWSNLWKIYLRLRRASSYRRKTWYPLDVHIWRRLGSWATRKKIVVQCSTNFPTWTFVHFYCLIVPLTGYLPVRASGSRPFFKALCLNCCFWRSFNSLSCGETGQLFETFLRSLI